MAVDEIGFVTGKSFILRQTVRSITKSIILSARKQMMKMAELYVVL